MVQNIYKQLERDKGGTKMNTIVKSSNGITVVPAESRLFAKRKLFIKGEITAQSACEFLENIMVLVDDDPDQPIHVFINSPGGEVNAGLMIYDFIKGARTPIKLYCVGMAASMAAIILAGGRKGERYILPHSKVMIHEPLIAGGVGGSATSIKHTADSIMETKRLTVELLAADTGKTEEEIDAAISYDNYMNANECVEFGICDKIITEIKD